MSPINSGDYSLIDNAIIYSKTVFGECESKCYLNLVRLGINFKNYCRKISEDIDIRDMIRILRGFSKKKVRGREKVINGEMKYPVPSEAQKKTVRGRFEKDLEKKVGY